jgi:Dynamin GTPase effector domain
MRTWKDGNHSPVLKTENTLTIYSRQKRMQTLMTKKAFNDSDHGAVIKLDDVVQSYPMSNTQHIVQDIHDILCSYYKVARKRFVDNICMQAVDHFLINGPQTPLTLFSSSFVSGLNADELERIAGEDNMTKRRRHQLRKEIESLEAGKKILT